MTTSCSDIEARLSPLDVAFLGLEKAAPMHLGAVLTLTPTPAGDVPAPASVAEVLRERAARMPRLRQRITSTWTPPGGARWNEDPRFDVRAHIHTHQVPGGGWDALCALTAELLRWPLELDRPPWGLHVVGGLDGGAVAVVVLLHHALCDGAAAIKLGLSLLDPRSATGSALADEGSGVPMSRSAVSSWPPSPRELLRGAASAAAEAGTVALATTVEIARDPVAAAGRGRAWLATGTGIAVSVVRQMRLPAPRSALAAAVPRPRLRTPLAARPAPSPRVVRMIRLDEARIRRIRRGHGGTSHDVMLAVLTCALRTWLQARGEPVDDVSLRALIPVNHRARSITGGANQLSGYLVDLPVAQPDPVARLAAVRAAMHVNKTAGPGRGAGALPLLAHAVPPAAHRALAPLAARHTRVLFDLVVTTVRLPAVPLSLAGAAMGEVYPLVPLAPGHALGIALCHHRGALHIGLHGDARTMPDVDKLAEAIPSAVTKLADTVT
ncbi:wax ester/triacylglycerol synthase family O-acyltransferase [Amycolatopsis sp. cg5]|uniref:wax ester/triacylglycerol synthase family O-acyltransferase n=1 Tax=Amycolatopsis sp. cg5 TaxID=3238802 RepID=UPI00352534C8